MAIKDKQFEYRNKQKPNPKPIKIIQHVYSLASCLILRFWFI